MDRLTVDDAQSAIEWLAARQPARPFNVRRIAALGHGIGTTMFRLEGE